QTVTKKHKSHRIKQQVLQNQILPQQTSNYGKFVQEKHKEIQVKYLLK
ncbi:20452_t:CDS:1, partial [Gigaspora rosea]